MVWKEGAPIAVGDGEAVGAKSSSAAEEGALLHSIMDGVLGFQCHQDSPGGGGATPNHDDDGHFHFNFLLEIDQTG